MPNGNDVQSEEQIFTEVSILNLLTKILIRCGNEPHIHPYVVMSSPPVEILALEVRVAVWFADLMAYLRFHPGKTVPPSAASIFPMSRRTAPVKAPFHARNNFILSKCSGRAATHDHKWFRRTIAPPMDSSRDDLFPSARFSEHQHGHWRPRPDEWSPAPRSF